MFTIIYFGFLVLEVILFGLFLSLSLVLDHPFFIVKKSNAT
jgi:hypothetical protein